MDSVDLLVQSPVSDVLTLVRRFEPVLRYTRASCSSPCRWNVTSMRLPCSH
jgi:hypothetical protein